MKIYGRTRTKNYLQSCCRGEQSQPSNHYYYHYKISFNLFELFRISEEIDLPQLKIIHKTLDIGEKLFIEKFLELETRI